MLRILRRTVGGLCQSGRADEALLLLEQVRKRCSLTTTPLELQLTYWRLLGVSLAECGLLRRSAAAFRHMLYLMNENGISCSPDDWGRLAAVYRRLWRQTEDICYHRRYLMFSCEQTDLKQVAMANQALKQLRRVG